MRARHLEFLVEEQSMEAFLQAVLPRVLPHDRTFAIHAFTGKHDLLRKLPERLRGYEGWLPDDWRVVVIVDRDDDDCRALKSRLESDAGRAGLCTRSQAVGNPWRVVNRIATEELEAWYFGEWNAVLAAYPRVSATIPRQAAYRDPDAIRGGTWEAFERILKRHGYFRTGMRKIEAARSIAAHVDPEHNRSRSFAAFRDVILEAVR